MQKIIVLSVFIMLPAHPCLSAQEQTPTYWKDIRPIFRKHCIVCHSKANLNEPDISAGLALDSYQATLKGSEHAVVEKGKSDKSILVHLLQTADRKKRMPLDARPLSKDHIALIRKWIDRGLVEGKKSDTAPSPPIITKRRPTRKLDVVFKTTTTPPPNIFGKTRRGPLELRLKVGPLSPVTAVAFSTDGRLLAAGRYGLVTVWDLDQAQPAKTLTNVLGAVNDLQFSPDGKWLAVGGGQPSAKGDLRLFRTTDWQLHAVVREHEDVVFSLDFAPKGDLLASASFDKTVRVWKVPQLSLQKTMTSHSDFVYAVSFGPKGKYLSSASKDRSIRLVESATGDSKFTFSGMNQDVLAVAFHPDGKHVISSGYESQLYWWDATTGKQIRRQSGHGVAVNEIQLSGDGQQIVTAGSDRTVRMWNGKTGALTRTISVGSVVYAVAIGPKKKYIASGSFDGLVRIWDAKNGAIILTLTSAVNEKNEVDWLAQTPHGYSTISGNFATQARWLMSGQQVPADKLWPALRQPKLVAQYLQSLKIANPTFAK